ncbi:MAG: hypothetical protein IJT04_07120 [Bacteroidales bacterium]|nr:hypothetical protein [Bacteroidales bacterium]
MAVFLNANSISELQFHPPGGSRRATEVVSKTRVTFEDYFPRTQKHFSGYLREECFKSKLSRIFLGVLKGMKGSREEMEKLAAQNTQGGYLNPALKPKAENYPKKLNEFHHAQYVRQTNMELKDRIMEGLEREEWYSFEKLEMADKVYEESKRYFKAAGTEVALFAVGFGIGKIGKPIAKSTKTLKGNIIQGDRGVAITQNGKVAKTMPVNREWSKEVSFDLFGKDRKLELLGADLGNANLTAWGQVQGEVSEHLHPEDTFESLDCLKDFGTAGVVAGAVVPYIGIASTFVNTLGNVILGGTNYFASKRIRAIEEETNRKDAEFLSKLKHHICADFNELQDDEIEALMKHLGINKTDYIPL